MRTKHLQGQSFLLTILFLFGLSSPVLLAQSNEAHSLKNKYSGKAGVDSIYYVEINYPTGSPMETGWVIDLQCDNGLLPIKNLETETTASFPLGYYNSYHRNGTLMDSIIFEPTADTLYRYFFDEEGRSTKEITIVLDSVYDFQYPIDDIHNATLYHVKNYLKGRLVEEGRLIREQRKDGTWNYYHSDGSVKLKQIFRNGNLVQSERPIRSRELYN